MAPPVAAGRACGRRRRRAARYRAGRTARPRRRGAPRRSIGDPLRPLPTGQYSGRRSPIRSQRRGTSLGILIPLGDRAWVLPGGVNIGVLANDEGQVVLVDTGLNDSSAKKALRVVREELSGEVAAVLTTHAHADHFGGNATVVKRTGAVVHAPKLDEAYLRYPLLQPASLFGGADPLDTLRSNFLLADPSPVDTIVETGPHEVV